MRHRIILRPPEPATLPRPPPRRSHVTVQKGQMASAAMGLSAPFWCNAVFSGIEEVEEVAGLRRRARIDEELDRDIAPRGNPGADVGGPGRVIRGREHAAHDGRI